MTAIDQSGRPIAAYGSIIYDDDTGFTVTVTTAGTPIQVANAGLTAGYTSPTEAALTTSATAGEFTANRPMKGEALLCLSVSGDEAATQLEVLITKNDARVEGGVARQQVEGATELHNVFCVLPVELDTGDVLGVYFDTDTNGDVFTIKSLQFTFKEVHALMQ